MADEQIVTNIVATSDFSGLIADVQRTSAALAKFKQQVALTNTALASQANAAQKALGDTLRATGQFSTHFVTVSDDVQKFGKQLDSGKLKLRDYFKTWQEHTRTSGGLIRDLAQQQVALQNAVVQPLGKAADGMMKFNVHVPKGLDNIKNKTLLARTEMQIYNKVVQDGGVQLINWGKNTQWAGRQLTVGLTVPIAGFGMAAAKAFREVDKELTRLTKVYGDLSKTSSTNLQKVRDDVSQTAKELSASMGVSFKDTIALAADIAATGKTGNELLRSVEETTRLSVLGEVDRQEAMKATLAIQSAFKQNTEELSQSINFLNAVENQTSTSLSDLVEAIPKAGPVVKGLGGDVKDLALYLTAMREGGINATEGANALKSGLASLINPTKVAVGQFKSFGIDLLGIVNNNAGNVTQTLLDLQGALDKLNPLQKQQAIEQLFGKFQFSRMNALFENLGKQGSQTLQVLDLMKASSADLQQIATGELAQVTESAAGKYARALETLKANMAEVGDKFLTIGTSIIGVVNKVLDFINKMPEPLKNIITIIGGFTALAGPLIMLTGVFANFFGYIIKGIGHFKALFKGGEGFKLLTPEMVAAQKAGDLIEKTFYSDAEAALALKAALQGVNDQLTILQQKAASGSVSVQPTISTVQGNTIIQGASRVANPEHPLIGPAGSRASAHMNPVSGMTEQQKMNQTIFGMVPNPIPLNRNLGATPQVYMNDDMPLFENVTARKGKSVGVVAAEAAKWHSMTGALAMQSKEEIAVLKKEVASTGAITSELSASYQALLPQITNITTGAAQEASLIVADLQAGKIKVDVARQKIIDLNIAVEKMIVETTQAVAISQGRVANLTTVPLTSQPVIDPKTGKSNMKELFHKSSTSTLVNKIAGALGVRTSGGGYSIETTKPKRLNSGGYVYTLNDGNIVPGPNVNADVVPAMLTPGEFVVNAKSTRANLPLLQAINGSGSTGPGYNIGSNGAIKKDNTSVYDALNNASKLGRGEQYKVMALLEHAGISIPMLQNSVYPMMHGQSNLTTRGGRGIPGAAFLSEFSQPGAFDMASRLMSKAGYGSITDDQKSIILSSLSSSIGNPQDPLTEMQFGKHLTAAYLKAGLSKDAIKVLASTGAMRFSFPGEGTIDQRRSALISTLSSKYGKEIEFAADPKNENNIIVKVPGQKPFKIRHEATRAITSNEHGLSYETQRQAVPAGQRDGKKLSYAHIPIDELQLVDRNPNTSKFPDKFLPHAGRKTNVGMPLVRRGGSFGLLKSLQLGFDPIGAAIRKTGSRAMRNRGGMIHLNKGGMVPGYNAGGAVGAYRAGLKNSYGKSMFGNGLPTMGLGTQMGIGMAGMAAGQAVGGGAGTAIMIASNILPMLSGLKMVGGFLPTLTKVASILGRLTIPGAVIGSLFMMVKGLQMWRKSAEDAGEVNRAMYGGTKSALAEVGLKYVSISDKIKEMNKQLELSKAKVETAYDSFSGSGVSGLTLTIKELKEGIASAKKNAKETVSIFNKADDSKVVDLASSMKAQFVAMGMSVQEATNKIYTIISASDKANQAFSAISSKGFKSIIDKSSAATHSLSLLGKQLSDPQTFNAEEFQRGLDNVISSFESYRQSLVGTKVDGQVVDQAKSLELTFEKLKATKTATLPMDQNTLTLLKSQDLALGSMLGNAETILSVFAKYRLYLSGLSTTVDIGLLTPDQAVDVAAGYERVSESATKVINKQTSIGKVAVAARAAADKAAKAANNAAKQDSQSIDDQIKAKQKLIDKLEEERDKRLEILDIQEKSQNFETQVKQAQIRYQQALATGNLAQAAQEKLSIEQLSADRQRELARQSINDKYDADIKKLEDQIQRLQDQKDSVAKAVASSQSASENKAAVAAEAEALSSELASIIAKHGGKYTAEAGKEIAAVLNNAKSSSNASLKAAAMEMEKKYSPGGLKSAPGPSDLNDMGKPYQRIFSDLSSETLTLAKAGTKFDKAVDAFTLAVETFTGKKVTDGPKTTTTTVSATTGQVETKAIANRLVTQNGIEYVVTNTGVRYRTDQEPGKTLKKGMTPKAKGWNGMRGMAGTVALVGENGPEIIKFNQTADIIPTHKFNMPMYNLASNSVSLANNSSNGKMGGITIINNISGTDMNMEQLSEVVTRKTITAMKNIKDVNFAAEGKPGVKRI